MIKPSFKAIDFISYYVSCIYTDNCFPMFSSSLSLWVVLFFLNCLMMTQMQMR